MAEKNKTVGYFRVNLPTPKKNILPSLPPTRAVSQSKSKVLTKLSTAMLMALVLVSSWPLLEKFKNNDFFFSPYLVIRQDLSFIRDHFGGALVRGTSLTFSSLNNQAAIITTTDVLAGWFSRAGNWLVDFWQQIVQNWDNFLSKGEASPAPAITPELQEKIKQDILRDLIEQNLISTSTIDSQIINQSSASPNYGLMVIPTTGSTTQDEFLRKNLSRMFADETDIKFDQGGSAGVVTPIFRGGENGGDYIFILKPLP